MIRSLVDALLESPVNRAVRLYPTIYFAKSKSDEDRAGEFQEDARFTRAERAIADAAAKDPITREVVRAFLDGHDKSGDIAAHLQMPVADVYLATRRLRRRVASRALKEKRR